MKNPPSRTELKATDEGVTSNVHQLVKLWHVAVIGRSFWVHPRGLQSFSMQIYFFPAKVA